MWERSCSQDLMSWERADAFCKENGAHLVEINSLFQMDMLYTLMDLSATSGLELLTSKHSCCHLHFTSLLPIFSDLEGEWRWQGSGELVPDEIWNSGKLWRHDIFQMKKMIGRVSKDWRHRLQLHAP